MAENENPESEYILHEWDLKLIQAAIRLGDTLMRLPEATHQNKQDITRFQEILRRLPKVTTNVWASYSFAVSKLEIDFVGVNREWYVCLEKGELITIGSVYCTVPDRDIMEDSVHEDWFMFEPGWSRDYEPDRWLGWAREVSDPNRWRRSDQDFEIETEFEVRK
jgi:hypothetical protein